MRKTWWILLLLVVLSACSRVTSASKPDATEDAIASDSATTENPTPAPTSAELLPPEPAPRGAEREFETDFSRHTIPYDEVLSGGPPKDGIPAIDEPQFVSVGAADEWLDDVEPVILVRFNEDVRAYPVQILMWHEIVNDTVGDVPVVVTFCPLCNTAIAFEREFAGQILDFGTTGRLRFSNLIMYDRQTETWWQQATGEGIAGEFAGHQLTFVPADMIAWSDFRDTYAQGKVLSRATGFIRSYGQNPYAGYDDINNSPFLFDGPETPGILPPMARVFTVELNDEAVAYPYMVMSNQNVVNDTVGGDPIVLFWHSGVASALDQGSVAEGRDVGTVVAFSREVEGDVLNFRLEEDRIVDEETGSTWDVVGRAVDGPLAGAQLAPVVGVNHFWFSWAAFKPETRVYQPEASSDRVDEARTDDTASGDSETKQIVDALAADFDIEVYQGADTLGGEVVALSDVLAQGRPVVMSFWAGLCPVCRRELPEVQNAYLEYGDEVTFIALDVGAFTGLGDKDDALSMIGDLSLTMPAATTSDPSAMQAYRVTGIPTTLYFKPDGEVFGRSGGLVGMDVLSEKIEALMAASEE